METSRGMEQLSEEGWKREKGGWRVGGEWRKTVEKTGAEEEKPLDNKRRVKRKERRGSDSDHKRAERWTFFCLSLTGLISLWLGSRVLETDSIKVELRGIMRGSGTILLLSVQIQTLALQRNNITWTTWRVYKKASHKNSLRVPWNTCWVDHRRLFDKLGHLTVLADL